MSTTTAAVLVVVGIACLGLGAAWLVDGASRLALRLGIRPMVVGLTVVGFGTSMPEFSVSVLAAGRGSGGLSIGNAVGSNVMNLLLVLGVSAILMPIAVTQDRRSILRDLIFGLVPAIIIVAMAWDGQLDRLAAVSLIVVFFLFMFTCVRQARRGSETPVISGGSLGRQIILVCIGIVVLVSGAELMVRGGVRIAETFGVSEALIGLTLVAFGTSLPELATSVVAALRRESEISIGNVLGSNVFNLGLIVGTAFAIRPGKVPVWVVQQDIPLLVLATALVGALILGRGKIRRREGALMIGAFCAYFLFVFLRGG
ncbi:MAG: calcium/sodium antiporter [bacterium]|nr:calcium/sodium antiporter [bacterium]